MGGKKALILIYTVMLLVLVSLGAVAGMWARIARVAGGTQTIIFDVGDVHNVNTTFKIDVNRSNLKTLVPVNIRNFDEGVYRNFVIVPIQFAWNSASVVDLSSGFNIDLANADFVITAKPTFNCAITDNILVDANEQRIHIMAIANNTYDDDFINTLSNAFSRVTCTEDAIPEMAKQFDILLEEPVQNDMFDFELNMTYGDSVFIYFIAFICSNITPAEIVYINSNAVISLSLSVALQNPNFNISLA